MQDDEVLAAWTSVPAEQSHQLLLAMLRTTGLNPADQGRLSEWWYRAFHLEPGPGGDLPGIAQARLLRIDNPMMSTDRRIDLLEDGVLKEQKSGAGDIDWRQIEDYLKALAGEGAKVTVPGKKEPEVAHKLRLTFLDADGARTAVRPGGVLEELMTEYGEKFTVEVFKEGKAEVFVDREGFVDLRAWLGVT